MFSEPQTVTIATVGTDLNRVAFGDRAGTFQSSDGGLVLKIVHLLKGRTRRTARLDHSKVGADPLLDGTNRPYSMSVITTIDTPNVGYSSQEVIDNLQAHIDWLNVAGNTAKLIGGES